jgi:hypothetical protein
MFGDYRKRRTKYAGQIGGRVEKRFKGGTSVQAPPEPPKPTYTAEDGTVFDDMTQFNSYNTNLKRNKFNQQLTSARQNSFNAARKSFEGRGLNFDDYDEIVNAELDNIAKAVPDLGNPDQFFGNSVGDQIISSKENAARSQYGQQVGSKFGTGFEQKTFADTADDAIIDQLFNEQYTPATDYIARAKQRGTLSDSGYQYALNNLNNMGTAARSKLQTVGGDVLNKYRTEIGGIGSSARNAANNYRLGETFDFDSYLNQFNNKVSEFNNRMGGDIRAALGNEQLFDLDQLIARAGSFQGPQNTVTLLSALEEEEKKRQQQRGLGGSGVF